MNLNISTHVFAVSSFCTHFFVVHLSSREIDWSLGMTDHHSLNVPLRLKLPIWCNKHQVLLIDYYFHKSSVFTYTPHPSINSLPTILSRQFTLFLSSLQITFYHRHSYPGDASFGDDDHLCMYAVFSFTFCILHKSVSSVLFFGFTTILFLRTQSHFGIGL